MHNATYKQYSHCSKYLNCNRIYLIKLQLINYYNSSLTHSLLDRNDYTINKSGSLNLCVHSVTYKNNTHITIYIYELQSYLFLDETTQEQQD